MRHTQRLVLALTVVLVAVRAEVVFTFDKNGVAPSAISLPSGPGSIQGLGESFQPQLNSGGGSYRVPLPLPKGTGGMTPGLGLVYNSGGGNGAIGLGWSLAGAVSIRRNTDKGVPRYVDGPNGVDDDLDAQIDNPEELDTYTGVTGEELVPLADGSFRAENESGFVRYTRVGGGWEARTPEGGRSLFGQSAAARIEDGGRVVAWCIERQIDRHGNSIEYEYAPDPETSAQKYLRRVRWGQVTAYFAAVLRYEQGRPDVTTSYQSGFALRTGLRLTGIDICSQGIPAPDFAERGDLDGDGTVDALIRRLRLEYDPTSHLSLLTRVTVLGADGVTAMPSLSFGYSEWSPVDNVAANITRSRGAPAEGFDSPSAELIDMNGDALPDLLSTSGNQHRVAINLGVDVDGRLVWAPLRPVGNAPTIDLASDRTHLADATADGLSDLLVKVSNTSFLCFDNTSRNSWTNSPFPIRNTDTWPIWPYDGDAGKLSRSIDIDYSRSNDVLHTSNSGNQLWLLLSGGRFSREVRLPPLVFEGSVFRFDLPGTHIADVNGDRLQDLVWIQATRVVCFPSRGRGDFAAPVVWSLGRTLSAAEIERAGFSDVDGDGLVDLTLVRPSFQSTGVVYWLNRFDRGLEPARTVLGLPALSAGEALRWADMNGNGTTDVVISQAQSAPGEKILVMDLIPEGKIHLLTSIDNGLGLRMRLEYESSTAQMVRAETAGEAWASVMPIATNVVRRIAEDDGRGNVFDQTFTYRDPYYDAVKQEFRGFHGAESREAGDASVAGSVTRLEFDTGMDSDCLKGRTLSEEVLGEDGTLFSRSLNSWSQRVLDVGVDRREVCFAFLASSDSFVHEGQSEGLQIRQETDYDGFGNVVEERNYGVLFEEGDELFTERNFDLRVDDWLLRLPSSVRRTDGGGRTIDEKRFFHNATGDLERVESWLDTDDRFVPVRRQVFDAFGNVVETTDARGHRRTMGFDTLLHLVPVSETLHLEAGALSMSADYDLGFGVVTQSTDFHGQRTDYSYDALGRLVEQRRPGGAGELFEYHFGNPVSRVTKRLRLEPVAAGGATFDSYFYSDAYGKPLGSRVAAEDGRWRVLDARTYNARKLENGMWLPYSSDTPDHSDPETALPHERKSYDALGRLVESARPDGSVVRQEYRQLEIAIFDGNDNASGGAPDVRRSDGLGRLREVEERNGDETYVTTYAWRASGELESVVDALGNTRRFRFDSLGRLVEMDDPDRGARHQSYDDADNLIEREDARGRITRYRHDAANRILERDDVGVFVDGVDSKDAVYHYDAPAGPIEFGDGTSGIARNVQGRLAWIEDTTGEEHFSYDERGNVEWVVKRVRNRETGVVDAYRTQQSYDLLNRETETIFPDNDRLRVVRGAGGFVERIDGGPEGRVVLAEADFAANGQPLRLRFGSGAESRFEYDTSQRLESLLATDATGHALIDESIAYDLVSNVIAIADGRPLTEIPASSPRRRTAEFQYDELNRLTRASYGAGAALGRIDYALDPLGNLLRQSTPPTGSPGHLADPSVDLGDLGYAGGRSGHDGRGPFDPPGPHAVTSTASGQLLRYDSNGNVSRLDDAILSWDHEDRLVRFVKPDVEADYGRDHSHRRVLKRVRRGGARQETLYVDDAFEVENGAPIKYAFLDGRRLARIVDVLDPTRERVQRIVLAAGWNLIAVAVETSSRLRDIFGIDAAVYEPRGSSYAALDPAEAVPLSRALWVHAPTARLAVVRGRVPQTADSDSPGPLHAWPRLEAFQPALHLDAAAVASPILVYDAVERRWLRRDPAAPAFLNDAPVDLGAARAFWSERTVRIRPAATTASALVAYHADHLGSPAALTDAAGELLEERAHYPYGAARSVHRTEGEPGDAQGPAASAGGRWDFTGKERDAESGLVDMGRRSYLELAGVFMSPDPRFAEAAALGVGGGRDQTSFTAFLHNPQMGNLYAHAARNPLKYVDPSGLEIVFSPVLQKSPVFQEALALFKSTQEGQRLLAHIEHSKFKVTVSAGKAITIDPKTGKATENLGVARGAQYGTGRTHVEINVMRHKANYADHDTMILELADTIHHELRHHEGSVNQQELAEMRKGLDWIRKNALDVKSPSKLPADPTLWMFYEVHDALDVHTNEPLNVEFRKQAQHEQQFQRDGVHLQRGDL